MKEDLVIGIDFGTDSVRSVIVNAGNGEIVASSVAGFSRWGRGEYCDPRRNMFRQHPLDHIESLEKSLRECLAQTPMGAAAAVRGIAVDTTGSSPGPVDRRGVPLALHEEFRDNPNAMFVLWKDHTSVAEAAEINHMARTWGGTDFTRYEGGVYSSEWFWSKILHVLREDETVGRAAWTWLEHCDWVPALLCGIDDPKRILRSRCAAGHKAMWHESFDGLPSEEFLVRLDPRLAGLRGRLYRETYTSDRVAGYLCRDWADRLGLPEGIPVAVGAFDAHMGAVGAGIQPYILTRVIGTSTCDILVAPLEGLQEPVAGICGQVDGSVIPGMMGLEAGQSAYGDVFAWFRDLLLWPLRNLKPREGEADGTVPAELERVWRGRIYEELSRAAQAISPGESGILAMDWLNGRRTPDANQRLTGAITGLNLGSSAPMIFRALVESTAFGARCIIERFEQEGVPIKGIIALGGVARQSPFAMQVLADVVGREIAVSASDQACALGAAMFAACVAGKYGSVLEAQAGMNSGFEKEYIPDKGRREVYSELYRKYRRLGGFVEAEIMGGLSGRPAE